MKNTLKLFVTILAVVFAFNTAMAQPPTYSLAAKNFTFPNPNQMEFDIYLLWTNPSSDPFEYGSCQYCFTYNPAASAGQTWTYAKVAGFSDLPPGLQPSTSWFAGGELRLTGNLPAPGTIVSSVFPGTRVVRTRVTTNIAQFLPVPLQLAWKYTGGGLVVKVSYLTSAGPGVFITDGNPANNTISDTSGALPVELSSFTSTTNRNNVTLNWSTASETNNQGFDIERSAANANTWSKVGNVNGNGTTNETKSYTFSDRATTGKYSYRLKQIDFNGNFEYFNLGNEVEVGVPSAYAVSQNYPNPFNPTTKIDYDIPFDGKVSILLYDISGRQVGNLVNDVKTAGYYTIQFNASNLSSGMYFYRISAEGNGNNFVSTKKMVLIK